MRSQAEGWLQGFITTTTFTVWQRNFRWDSHAPESGMAEDDLTERKWDKDNSLSMELEAQDRSGNPDAEVLPCHHLPHPPTPSIFPPPRNDVRGSSESLGRSGGGSTGDTTTRMFAECMCAEEVIDSHAHARGAPAGSPVCGGAWPTVVKSSMLMGWLTRQGIIFPNVAELSLLGGLGCGTRLVNLLIEQLEAGGKHDFLIVQATDNSVAFYETFGFVRVGAVALYRGRVDEGPLGWGCSTLPTWIRNKRVRFTVGSAGASAGTAAAASGGAAAGGVAGGGGGDSSATPGGAGDDSRGAFSIVVDQEWGASRGFRLVQMQILKDGTERVREWRCAGELEPFDAGGLPFVADRLWAQPLEPNKTLPVRVAFRSIEVRSTPFSPAPSPPRWLETALARTPPPHAHARVPRPSRARVRQGSARLKPLRERLAACVKSGAAAFQQSRRVSLGSQSRACLFCRSRSRWWSMYR